MSAASVVTARGSAVGVLWRFSRPHTIVGTAVSVLGLYAIAAAELPGGAPGAGDVALTLLAALSVNVFIVGINQLTDIEIDRVNKPGLPLAAGDMTWRQGVATVALAGTLPVILALTQGPLELAGVLAGLAAGVAYSCPPVRLKRFPVLAAMCISAVRSAVVNLVVFAHFAGGTLEGVPDVVWAATLFFVPFSVAIAVLKDVPDMEGDRRYEIATFTVRMGPERATRLGMAALVLAYLGMAVLGPLYADGVQPVVLSATHVAALAVLLALRAGLDVHDRTAFTRFYMRVWGLFFLEYALLAAAALA